MGKHLVWVVVFLVVAVCGGEFRGGEPVGDVYRVRVNTWGRDGQTSQTQGTLLVPKVLDRKGTLTLVTTVPVNTDLVTLDQDEVPESLHFLFGELGRIYVRAYRPDGTYLVTTPITVQIPFDRDDDQPKERRIRIVDAAERGVEDISLRVGFPRYSGHGVAAVELPVGEEGQVILPRVIDAHPLDHHLNRYGIRAPDAYHLSMTDAHGQRFSTNLKADGVTSETVVWMPVLNRGAVPEGVRLVKGRIVDADGNAEADCAVSLNPVFRTRMQHDSMRESDPTTVTVVASWAAPDGTFRFAVPDDFSVAKTDSGVSVNINEQGDKILSWQYVGAAFDEETVVRLPKRLTLTAQLLDGEGKPYSLTEHTENNSIRHISIKDVGNPESVKSDSTTPRKDETTGSLFLLKNLAVPGRYALTYNDVDFGPVDIGETSPTEVVRFQKSPDDGRLHGRIVAENGKPLGGALVVVFKASPSKDDWRKLSDAVDKLAADDRAGMEKVLAEMESVFDSKLTSDSGEYEFLRREIWAKAGGNHPFVLAMAPGRIPAYIIESRSLSIHPASLDVQVREVRLPGKVTLKGEVSGPEMISDESHPGKMIPVREGDHKYNVSFWSTIGWFGGQYGDAGGWQYYAPSASFTLGEAFEYEGPAGTTFTLAARASGLPLSLQLWREKPASVGDVIEVESARLRALEPFKLRLRYSDGSPAAGLYISSLYNHTPMRMENGKMTAEGVDENGEMMMWGDEKLAPMIQVRSYSGMIRHESFQIQKLDTSTSVPVLTLTLDPEIWGTNGGGVQ